MHKFEKTAQAGALHDPNDQRESSSEDPIPGKSTISWSRHCTIHQTIRPKPNANTTPILPLPDEGLLVLQHAKTQGPHMTQWCAVVTDTLEK